MKLEATSTSEIETTISGVTFDDPVTGINRQKLIKAYVKPGLTLHPELEPDNPVDPGAVGLHFSKRIVLRKQDIHIGYVPKNYSARIAALLADGHTVHISVIKRTGGTKEKSNYGVVIKISY